jgi:formate hydrogenlyase transcriptional activator
MRLTKKLNAKNALKESESKYQTLFECANDAIFVNQGRYFVDCNTKACEIYGCSKDQIIGKTYVDFSAERQPDGTLSNEKGLAIIKLAARGTPQFFEWKAKKFDGTEFMAELSLNRIDSSGETFMFAVVRDITSRKKTEGALLEALREIEQLKERIQADYTYLREEIKLSHNYDEIIGQSEALNYVLRKVEQIAPIDTTTIILGESGVGKELVARAIHSASRRKNRPLVKVNCTTLPSNLIESELFGHERGAFTGAFAKQVGRFELADGATIFLDEIGELPLELQPKLLRVLQEGEFDRLGSMKTIKTDVRIIAATNRNLEEEVRNGRFREDLWYRLNVFPITIPPLCQRKEDIPLLVSTFVNRFNKLLGKSIKTIPNNVLNSLKEYSWPGNIRELKNVIERAMIICEGSVLSVEIPKNSVSRSDENKTLVEVEREYLLKILKRVHWKIEGNNCAAHITGLNASTLRSKMKRLGIQRPNY